MATEQKGILVVVDQDGDVAILVQDRNFLVRSSKMSAVSPIFKQIFSQPLERMIKLPNEDPEAFYQICLSAHDFLVPQTNISTDTLVKMAHTIDRYKISSGSNVYNTVFFNFVVQALRPETIPTSKLRKLLQVAKALGPAVFRELLENAFLLRPLHFEKLPVAKDVGFDGKDCAVVLGRSLRP